MAQIFPKWTNHIPTIVLIVVVLGGAATIGFFWYFGSPEYTDVGYRPVQPVPYSHRLHAGELGLDCRYCHTGVERSAVAGVPPAQTCMNCHTVVKYDSKKLQLVRDSYKNGTPIPWRRVHKIPEYAYFDHSAHVTRGVGCAECHGRIDQMEVVRQVKPLSMSWCLECHRDPATHLRPADVPVTKMDWQPPSYQDTLGPKLIAEHKISPPTDCSGCHR